MWKRVPFAVAIAVGVCPLMASAAGYSLSAKGTRQSTTSATTCGAQLGDAYDTFCPSDPSNSTTCNCDSYDANISGNRSGSVTDNSGVLNITTDVSAASDTPDCQPIFGELTYTGTKDAETIYLNGSHCLAKSNGDEALTGGWGTFSSSHSIKAFGTFVGTLKPDHSYSVKLSGKTQ